VPRIGRTTRRRRAAVPGALSALVAAALLGALAPSIPAAPGAPASVAGATTITAGVHGTYAHPGAGELWGGTNPDENCVSCTVTGLLALNPAQSVAPGQPVDPVTGDYSTQDTLFSVPATYGTLGVTLTYDAQRAIAQAKKPATYPYATGGAAGAGWTSSLTSSATLKINERTGAQVFFYELGTSATQHDADGCKVTGKPGLYADFQKFTVPRTKTPTTPTGPTAKYVTGSTIAFCAARRVNAQLGYISAFGGYELRSQEVATVAHYSSTYGDLVSYSNASGDLRSGRTIKLSYSTTTPALHCGTEGETKCIVKAASKTGSTVTFSDNTDGLLS
jgi:hypothetical protein